MDQSPLRTIDGVLGQPPGTPSMLPGYQGTAWRDAAEARSAASVLLVRPNQFVEA